ncbi:histidine kinase [Sediminicola sp. 1XM1-17]|uniref:histidine kinase n=1 Tax=Sediminicola sp. 1XM1-17 TaxID=3127702 RepID=UPI003077C0A7
MPKRKYIVVLLLFCFATVISQVKPKGNTFDLQGTVVGKENNTPISGVSVTNGKGSYTTTNGLGEFKLKVAIGDRLVIEGSDFQTLYYMVKNQEELKVLVEGYVPGSSGGDRSNPKVTHQMLLDSALRYKKTNIDISLDFITKSILKLGSRGDKGKMAESLSALGEIYHYHKQYDLAIANYLDALRNNRTIKTEILLGKSYLMNRDYDNAERIFLALVKGGDMIPYQKVEIYEGLGDAQMGLGNIMDALKNYNRGLQLAKQNLITPKMTDLNSKIGTAYAQDNKMEQAEEFYDSSLKLASKQAPQRAVQEKEKVADFYNQKSQYSEEIELRKKSLDELNRIPKSKVAKNKPSTMVDTITTQRINYKIANAYIAQDKLSEAIPYLQQSIKEADADDDLVVQKDATRKLSELYKYTGEYSKALETYQQYVSVVDTLYVRKEQELSRAARFNREIAAKQSRISGLEQERQLSQSKYDLALTEQELIAESNKRQIWIIYSLVLGLLLMGLVVFFFYRSNRQQKLANNLLALKSLRSQMNPHFIFNALNSVNNYIAKSDERSANRFLSDFSTLMRSVLENSEEDFIPLTKELDLLELYVKLEHSRFPDKFEYQLHVDDRIEIDKFQIPPMLLQPYIENAIWHGLRYKEDKGFLKIELQEKGHNEILITISDDGIGRKKSGELKTPNQLKQRSKGMGNIKKRIAILNDMYKDRVAVTISDLREDETGTKVELILKKE